MKPTEAEETRVLANRILDRPNADPDDDLAMLSRQLLRADARVQTLLKEKFQRQILAGKQKGCVAELSTETLRDLIIACDLDPSKPPNPPRTREVWHFMGITLRTKDEIPYGELRPSNTA
jgi:hypothetical protein